ncbi:MAG: hypothetical protein ACFFDH_21870 [Promethearchaeota archaeon]
MELFQVFWGDQDKLFLEFKKNEKEKRLYLPERIKRLNLQFEISKLAVLYKEPPYLISIKKIYHSKETIAFTIDLDLVNTFEDLQIKILQLYIILNSGQKIEYSFRETLNISEIEFNEDYYSGFEIEDLNLNKHTKSTYTQEKIYEEIKTNSNNSEQKRTRIIEKKIVEDIPENTSLISMVNESNKSLKNIEEQLKNLAIILKNMNFKETQYIPSIPIINKHQEGGIERIKKPVQQFSIEGQISSGKLMVIKEMKSIFRTNIDKNSEFNIRDILKPLTENELESMVLNDEELEKKEQEAIKNQIKRIKKQQEEKIRLENLKPPE